MKLSNFKTLAVAAAFAATASTGAVAQIDLDDAAETGVLFADEAKGTVDGNGRYPLLTSAALTVTGEALVGTGVSTVRYIRYALTNAVFDGVPTWTVPTRNAADGGAGVPATISTALGTAAIIGGGASQDAFVAFQVTTIATNQIKIDAVQTLAITTGLDVSPAGPATITYSVHDSASDAVSGASPISSSTAPYVTIQPAYANGMAACDAVATVASGFTTFAARAAAGTCPIEAADGDILVIGSYTAATTVTAGHLAADGAAAVLADITSATQVITLTGDVTNGVFSANTVNTCAAGTTIAMTKNADNTAASTAATANTAVDLFFCLDASGLTGTETIKKGDYTIQAMTDQSAAIAIGSITYDTTTVEAPYITTYEGYNQRIFIDNRGATAAYYSTTFTTEAGVTAAAGTAGTGTVPANTMATVRVSDLVTFTGGTRGSATMEIEATDGNIWVTTQIVDLGTGMTDTLVLN
jgi:hypothetical protein